MRVYMVVARNIHRGSDESCMTFYSKPLGVVVVYVWMYLYIDVYIRGHAGFLSSTVPQQWLWDQG